MDIGISMAHKKLFAFTLAEVLLTLVIVGIVAALTIPALIQSTNDAQFKSAWKKKYSELYQATKYVEQDNLGTMVGLGSLNNLTSKYMIYLNQKKVCYAWGTLGVCWHADGEFYNEAGSGITGWDNSAGMILNDGSYLLFGSSTQSNTCTATRDSMTDICGEIIVDVNGQKGPNRFNKDIFRVFIRKNKITPCGSEENPSDVAFCGKSAEYLK